MKAPKKSRFTESMPEADNTKGAARSLGAMIKKVKALWSVAERDDVMARYAIGEIVRDIDASPEKYGKRAVKRLAEELGQSRSLVYSYGTVAKTWTRGDLRSWLKQAEGRLKWSHLVRLSAADVAAKTRDDLVEKIVGEGMSIAVLEAQLPSTAKSEATDEVFEILANSQATSAQSHKGVPEVQVLVVPQPSAPKMLRIPVTIMHAAAGRKTVRIPILSNQDDLVEFCDHPPTQAELIDQLNEFAEKSSLLARQARFVLVTTQPHYTCADSALADDTWTDALLNAKAATEELAQACERSADHLDAAIAAAEATSRTGASTGETYGDVDVRSMRVLPSGEIVTKTTRSGRGNESDDVLTSGRSPGPSEPPASQIGRG